MAPYNISIKCSYDELWRYNIAVMCEVRAAGERVELLKHIDEIASVGSRLTEKPEGYNNDRNVVMHSVPGEQLLLYVYIIPHSLPDSRRVESCPPFNIHIAIEHGGKMLHNRYHTINRWSGDNIEIKL